MPEMSELIKEELRSCKGPVVVFGGAINEHWKSFLEGNGIAYWDFMQMPEVIEGNAYITAEATLAEVLEHSNISIRGQNILVTGYGYCGKEIARLFQSIGAFVTVVARKEEVRREVEEEGCVAIDFSQLPEVIGQMNTVINTVPARVLTEQVIEKMQSDTLIIDIASRPGGTDFEAAKNRQIEAYLALGLPGIYTTKSSAQLLKKAISKYAPLQNEVREEKQWIFQIII